jgi:hypothetical protein
LRQIFARRICAQTPLSDQRAQPFVSVFPRQIHPAEKGGRVMPDISMCGNETCVLKGYCYRNPDSGTKPNEHRQAWLVFQDHTVENPCPYFVRNLAAPQPTDDGAK